MSPRSPHLYYILPGCWELKMNNKYMRYYKNFKPPPFAPTYRPTEEEFDDPIEYVKKIKPEAEKYGVVKIKPPKSFQPPFAIRSENFTFTPRVQRLNEIDGLIRLRLLFEMEITAFWELQGFDLKPPTIDNKYIDLYKLSRSVVEKGGGEYLTQQKKWYQVGKQLGLTSHQCPRLHDIYYKWVVPFEKCLKEIEEERELNGGSETECIQNVDGRRRIVEPKSRMMAGYRNPPKGKKTKDDSVDDVVCKHCKKGDDEDRLLLCEECNAAQHTYCCNPPLTDVPETEWRCYQCIKARVKSIGENFGFHDAQQEYNLVTFAEFANSWKRDYFQKKILETTPEEVEREFWRKVADLNCDTSVKYGADLLASKVGSGFPILSGSQKAGQKRRKSDANWKKYAEHPWNLNNMPILKGSVLSHIDSGISGMMVPWVYIGMCFTTFCWHTEDHWTYSINYMHWGERKIWYGVSGAEGEKFDEVVNNLVPDLFQKHPDLLHHLTTMINPMILIENGIHVYTVHQEPGEFVITFPRAYHAGYNEGLNCAEAVNFAPPDWLRLGRLCIADYAKVHRKCVFSHDELVVRMVEKVGNMDFFMKCALYDELEKIVSKESKWLARFPKSKHRYERTKFERIYDDQRECIFCKTTLYLSALECKHARLSCLRHSDHLCEKCVGEDYYVKYRYTIDELTDMRKDVASTVEHYVKWKEKATAFLHCSDTLKPSLEDICELVNLSTVQRLPSCDLMEKLNCIIKDCKSVFDMVENLLSPLNRNKTYDFDCVMKLKEKIDKLPCPLPNNLSGFHQFFGRLVEWKNRAKNMDIVSCGEGIDYESIISELKRLIAEADFFHIVLPEVERLKQKLVVHSWLRDAYKLLRWRYSCNRKKLDGGYFPKAALEEPQKWRLKEVEKLIDDGTRLMETNGEIQDVVDEVHSCMKLGWNKEFSAEKILLNERNEGVGVERANEIWGDFEVCDWLSMEKLDELRNEIVKARNIQKLYIEGKGRSDITFSDLETYDGLCSQSFFMNHSRTHLEIIEARSALQDFMKDIESLFSDTSTNYTLYEASSFNSYFEIYHIDGSLCPSIFALRELNMKRNTQETCGCAESHPNEEVSLICCLCRGKTHGSP
ncbi:unnamed protein product [Enterobius vermicularis]|uniref:[histone H3]-trimethyl-L-lysine(4) demethylase n=1 Tax=Enterobius vermicularis TaxID=51028 RepID=A0A0N4USM1_ENTVE|nr:unnamed protein product [Enterobius vermicularis]